MSAATPVPGLAKTRLIPALGADGAAVLAVRLMHATVAEVIAAAIGPVALCCAPAIAAIPTSRATWGRRASAFPTRAKATTARA